MTGQTSFINFQGVWVFCARMAQIHFFLLSECQQG